MEHIVYFYIIFFIYTLIISFSANQLVQKYTLSISCIILCIIIGFRDIYYWNDAISYTHSFEFYTPTLFDSLSFKDIDKLCYNEKGFFLLSSLIKTISSDVTNYFTIIAAFSIFFYTKI